MNVLIGVIIGIISKSWETTIGYSIGWSVIHVIYALIFGMHKNPVTESTKSGKPVISYFMARFFTALITSIVIANITLFVMTLF